MNSPPVIHNPGADKTIIAIWAAIVLGAFGFFTLIVLLLGAMVWTAQELDGSSGYDYPNDQIDAGFGEEVFDKDDPMLGMRTIIINHDINARTAKDVVARLLYLNSKSKTLPIDLIVSTDGGWYDNAFSIIDTLRMIDAPVNTLGMGGSSSSGALILTCGTGTRKATEDTIVMVHMNLYESEDDYGSSSRNADRVRRVWEKTAQLPKDWFEMNVDNYYYLSADEAKIFGIIDDIIPIWEKENIIENIIAAPVEESVIQETIAAPVREKIGESR
jgi:ATP-dependent Clp protease protease subunit